MLSYGVGLFYSTENRRMEKRRKKSITQLVKASQSLSFMPRTPSGSDVAPPAAETGGGGRAVSISDEVRAYKDALIAGFLNDYPHLAPSVIVFVVDQCNGDALVCRGRLQELASKEASNPVFSSIYGGGGTTSPSYPYYPWNSPGRQPPPSQQSSAEGGRHRPAPLLVSSGGSRSTRTTQDSYDASLLAMATPPPPSALLSPPETSSTSSSASPNNSARHHGKGRNPFWFLHKGKRHSNAAVATTNDTAPSSSRERASASTTPRHQEQQTSTETPSPPVRPPRYMRQRGGGVTTSKSPSPVFEIGGRRATVPASDAAAHYRTANTAPKPAGLITSPPPAAHMHASHSSSSVGLTPPLTLHIPASDAQNNYQRLEQQRKRKDNMCGANDAHKLSIQEVMRDLHALSKFSKTEYKQHVHITESALRDLEQEVQELEERYARTMRPSVSQDPAHPITANPNTNVVAPPLPPPVVSSSPALQPAVFHKADRLSADGASTSSEPPAVDVGWSCSQCTFHNHGDLTRCEMCDLPRIGPPTTRPVGETMVARLASSSRSVGGHPTAPFECYCCDHSHHLGGEADTTATEREGRRTALMVAPMCTFHNHGDLTRCEMCDLPRIGPPTTRPVGETMVARLASSSRSVGGHATSTAPFECYCCDNSHHVSGDAGTTATEREGRQTALMVTPMCTFQNHGDFTRCEMCDLPRIGPPTTRPVGETMVARLASSSRSVGGHATSTAPFECYCCDHSHHVSGDAGTTATEREDSRRTGGDMTAVLTQLSAPSAISDVHHASQTSDDWTMVGETKWHS